MSAGVNVVGPFEAELGNGETARQLVAALDAAGVPVLPIGFVATASRQGHEFPHTTDPPGLFPVSILCVNADGTPRFRERLGDEFFAGRHTIGLWWWETTVLPDYMAESFALVDEVWAGSGFVADVLGGASDGTPVTRIDLPALLPAPVSARRAALELPDGPLVLVNFDHNSVLERKNPLGAIEAFRRAFPQPGAATLVVKSINGHAHPEAHARVVAAAQGRPDVRVLDGYLPAPERDALVAACDVFVSLHRAEGFGLTLAEALALERPVVAVPWSGPADFLDDEVAFCVRWTERAVGAGQDPYPAEGRWAEPDLDHAAELLQTALADRDEARRRATRGAERVRARYSATACSAAIARRVRRAAGLRGRLAMPRGEARRAQAEAERLHGLRNN